MRHHLTENRIQLELSYKFDSAPPAPIVAGY